MLTWLIGRDYPVYNRSRRYLSKDNNLYYIWKVRIMIWYFYFIQLIPMKMFIGVGRIGWDISQQDKYNDKFYIRVSDMTNLPFETRATDISGKKEIVGFIIIFYSDKPWHRKSNWFISISCTLKSPEAVDDLCPRLPWSAGLLQVPEGS